MKLLFSSLLVASTVAVVAAPLIACSSTETAASDGSEGALSVADSPCVAAGGECMTSPIDRTYPARCDQDYGRPRLSAACPAINHSCCAKADAGNDGGDSDGGAD